MLVALNTVSDVCSKDITYKILVYSVVASKHIVPDRSIPSLCDLLRLTFLLPPTLPSSPTTTLVIKLNNLVDKPVLLCVCSGHEVVPVEIEQNLLLCLPGHLAVHLDEVVPTHAPQTKAKTE